MVESNLSSSGSVPYLCVVMLCIKSCLVVPCNLPIAECSAEGFPFSVSGSGTPRVKLIEGPDHLRPIRCPSFIDLNDDHLTNTRFQAFAGRHPRPERSTPTFESKSLRCSFCSAQTSRQARAALLHSPFSVALKPGSAQDSRLGQ